MSVRWCAFDSISPLIAPSFASQSVHYRRRVNDRLTEYTAPVLTAMVAAASMIALVTHDVAT